MATAEVIQGDNVAMTQKAIPVISTAIQGSSQYRGFDKSASLSPVLFAPASSDTSRPLPSVWESVRTGIMHWVDAIVSDGPTRSKWSQVHQENAVKWDQNAIRWDRLSLELMRVASLGSNWDGEGAEPVSPYAVKQAGVLLIAAKKSAESASVAEYPVPSIYASLDGGVTFKWNRAGRELKCTVYGDYVEVVRWRSSEAYDADGFWEIPVIKVGEHFDWLLR